MTTTRRQFLTGALALGGLIAVGAAGASGAAAAPGATRPAPKGRNLVKNGSFEQGPIDKGFKHWTVTVVTPV